MHNSEGVQKAGGGKGDKGMRQTSLGLNPHTAGLSSDFPLCEMSV